MRPASPVFSSRRCGRGPRRAFSLAELLIVVGVLALLAAVVLPVFFAARKNAHNAACAANLRQLGLGLQGYLQDYAETYPPSTQLTFVDNVSHQVNVPDWCDLISPYTGRGLACPDRFIFSSLSPQDAQKPINSGYAYNDFLSESIALDAHQATPHGLVENVVKTPALTVAVLDARLGFISLQHPDWSSNSPDEDTPPGATRHKPHGNGSCSNPA